VGLTGRDIVCLSTQYWDERWFRKQQFMSRFSRENRILFVEPSFSMARGPERHRRHVATNRFFRPRLERREDHLFLLKPPRGLPKWSAPSIERATYGWYAHLIARAVGQLGFHDAILWVYAPAYSRSLARIPHRFVVVDLVDDLAAYAGDDAAGSAHMEASVASLVRGSDLLIVSAATLADRYGRLARRVERVSNGFDADLFSPSTGAANLPAPLATLPRPIIGFVGTIFRFLDFDLLEAVARGHADKSLVLVGPVEAGARASLARLTQLPNVTHVGAQPQSAIPDYVAGFDVCLNPFRAGRVADSVNPLKVYEYLAAGKPVVSTPMEALRREPAGRVVLFAADAAAFCAQIEFSLTDDVQEAAEDRRSAAAPYSWDLLFARLDELCEVVLSEATST
jgi:glycosyltransferase involved in cell wall biosynthesis